MTLLVTLGFYLLAAAVPAYFLARNTGNIGRNILAWLVGFLLELAAVTATFLVVVSANPEAAPVLIAMTLTPPIPLLLVAPCFGLATAQVHRYFKTRRRKLQD
jgi:hypothetical protein